MGEREIREAAAVIAVRDAPGGPEILVIERSQGSRFLPGYVSFPGGRVDEEDRALAGRWFADPEQGARAGAVRELLEEVGLALTSRGLHPASHEETAVIDAAPPAADLLRPIAHWVAPEDVPVRFDALYFAVAGGADAEPTPDGAEIAAAWWVSPRRLLDEWQAGKAKLYWPTYLTMLALAECESAADLLALDIDTREPDENELNDLFRSVFYED